MVSPWLLQQEAAFEALGILESLHAAGELPAHAIDMAAAVIKKYHDAQKSERRSA